MRLCVVGTGEDAGRKGFKIAKIGEFRGVEIYKADIKVLSKKRQILRVIKKCSEELWEKGISFGAVSSDFTYISEFNRNGIALVTEKKLLKKMRAELALGFAKSYCPDADFLIMGGSRSCVIETATQILRQRRNVFVECANFEAVSEEILERTGVRIQNNMHENVLRLDMAEDEVFLRYFDQCAGFSDFEVCFEGDCFVDKDKKSSAALASVLEICGFLQKNEIKTACSLK